MLVFDCYPLKIIPTVLRDVCHISEHMRDIDKREIWDSSHDTPESALLRSYLESDECYTIFKNGIPVAIFGVSQYIEIGSIWMLGTDDLITLPKSLVRITPIYLDHFFKRYSALINFISEENLRSFRWLKKLGAKFSEPAPYGIEGKKFINFRFERSSCVNQFH